jgi:hypothetical protein
MLVISARQRYPYAYFGSKATLIGIGVQYLGSVYAICNLDGRDSKEIEDGDTS